MIGLISIYSVYEQSLQIEAMKMSFETSQMLTQAGYTDEAIKNAYIQSGIFTIIGVGLSIFGTKLVSKKEEE